jgi:large subunit ribosomal protein L23
MALKNIFKKKQGEQKIDPAQAKQAKVNVDKGVKKAVPKKQEDKKVVKKEKKAETKKATKVKKDILEKYDRVIVKPYITEKSAVLADANQYVFLVDTNANRVEIRNAVKAMYGVQPTRVNIQQYYGKAVRVGRVKGKRKVWKKAIVTLPKGSSINVYEGV